MQNKFLYYNKDLTTLARKLRNTSTLSEVLLWKALQNKEFIKYDFHRQKPIGNYIVDFFCPYLMLVIEIDGFTHDHKYNDDIKRQNSLESLGLHFLRFKDEDVKKNLDGVVITLQQWIKEHTPAHL